MGPPSCLRSVVDRKVFMRRMTVVCSRPVRAGTISTGVPRNSRTSPATTSSSANSSFHENSTQGKRSSSSIGTTAHCGLWPVEQCPSIFSYLLPTISIFSLPALEDLFLLPLSIFSSVFPFFSTLSALQWRSFWASHPPPFSPGDLTSLSFALLSILLCNKKPTRCHLVFYLLLLYKFLNMLRATLCPLGST